MVNRYLHDCESCATRCDGHSKFVYNFKSDVDYSEEKENEIIGLINNKSGYSASKCDLSGYPDIEVRNLTNGNVFYIEIKAQRRTFMSVKRLLPEAGLEPSETLALNLSDLQRYFEIRRETGKNIFILWFLENRPCIVEAGKSKCFYQHIDELEKIYLHYGDRRRFRRKSGAGDVVDGQHKGVVVNYHFSLNEFEELDLDKLLEEGNT